MKVKPVKIKRTITKKKVTFQQKVQKVKKDDNHETEHEDPKSALKENGSPYPITEAELPEASDLKRKVDELSEEVHPQKRKKVAGKRSAITADEINKWREVQFLHHSNLFRLQMNEMLSELRITDKKKAQVNSWLNNFSSFVKALPKSKLFKLNNLDWVEEEKIGPIPMRQFRHLPPVNGDFQFHPPSHVTLVGSFPLGLASSHSPVIDVALVLPEDFMLPMELSNCKWLLRRALYLAWIGKALEMNTDLVSDIHWTIHCGSPLRPILQLTAVQKIGKNWKINLFPVPPNNYFKPIKIAPTKSNISPSWFFKRETQDSDCSLPTPHYNWLCGVDFVLLSHHHLIKENLKHQNWTEGILLLKIWLAQRSLSKVHHEISSHLLTLYVLHLAKLHKISLQMSPYQVFRITLLNIAQTDWLREGPSMSEEQSVKNPKGGILTLADYHKLYPVVFVDPTGYFNISADVLPETYLEFQHQAKLGMEILELTASNSFESLFIQKVKFHMTFDQSLCIRLDKKKATVIANEAGGEDEGCIVDSLGDRRPEAVKHIISLLRRGLGDRVDLFAVFRPESEIWAYRSQAPKRSSDLILGLLVNPNTSTALLTKGPSAELESEVKEFRDLWGSLSTLRRFKDSTFHEAVLWADPYDCLCDRRLILGKMISYLMKTYFHIPESHITYVAGHFENILRMSLKSSNDSTDLRFRYGSGYEALTTLVIAFDSLSKKLRSLPLPLKISTIHSCSDALNYSAVFPPLPTSFPIHCDKENPEAESLENHHMTLNASQAIIPHYRPTIEVLIFLEVSGKWPDDLLAIQAIKAEFLCKIAEMLRPGIIAVPFPTHLSIIWEGYVFKLKICYRKEIFLMREATPESSDNLQSTLGGLAQSLALEKEITMLPKLTASLKGLHSQFASFSGALRLVRRWVSSQLLMPHFPPEVLDLLVAYLYLMPYPQKTPNSPDNALLRFMNFMAITNFKSTPIIINLNQEFDALDERKLIEIFTQDRSSKPPLFLCTPCELRLGVNLSEATEADLKHRYSLVSFWTQSSPSQAILTRMKLVASAALDTMCANMWKKDFDFKILFRPPLDDYDVLIFLEECHQTRKLENIEVKQRCKIVRPFQPSKFHVLPILDFDPAQLYVEELRQTFGKHALFFHDQHGGLVIGVVWMPHVFQESTPKIGSFNGHKLFGTTDVRQILNVDAIVEEFKVLGRGLVKEVRIKS